MAKPGKHCVGALAQITGLSTASLNGELGSLLCLTETGRWLVKIRGRSVAVKATNLRPQADHVPELFRRMVSAMLALQAQFFLELARSGATRRVVASCVAETSVITVYLYVYQYICRYYRHVTEEYVELIARYSRCPCLCCLGLSSPCSALAGSSPH